jgi:nucleoside-diphosphate-sugar epimerase
VSKRAIVTGAGGFIGRAVVDHLSKAKMDVVTLGRQRLSTQNHPHIHLEFPVAATTLISVFDTIQPDLILHLAAAPPVAAESVHMEITQNFALTLFEAAGKSAPHARILALGSAAEFGFATDTDRAMTEADMCRPASAYGKAKYNVTRDAQKRWADGQNIIIARLFTAFGPHMPGHTALGHAARQIHALPKHGGTIRMGHLNVERDYLDVEDVAQLILQLAGGIARDIPLVHVASGSAVNIEWIVNAMVRVSNKKINILQKQQPGQNFSKVFSSIELLRKSGLFPNVPVLSEIAQRVILHKHIRD